MSIPEPLVGLRRARAERHGARSTFCHEHFLSGTRRATSETDDDDDAREQGAVGEEDAPRRAPWWVWVVIVLATIGISFAGVLLQNELSDTPPVMRACWRLSLTTLFLMPMAWWEYRKWDSMDDRRKLRDWRTWGMFLGSGFALGVHFAAWVASLDETSLAHSLLFVTTSPLLILASNALFKRRRPSVMETAGVLISLAGAAITLLDIRDDKAVTAHGDALAFLGAVAIVFHIECGRSLRQWMPTTVYIFPVTFLASVFLAIISTIFHEREPVFGWARSPKVGWFVLLAFVSGIIGHAGFNLALGYVSSLVVSISTTMEPVIGTFIGWLAYRTSSPKVFTLSGGPLLLFGIVLVIRGDRPQKTNGRSDDVIANDVASGV